jgi:hypothetical protein
MTEPELPPQRAEIEVTLDAQTITLKVPDGAASLTPDAANELAGQLLEAAMLAQGTDPDEADIVRVPMQYVIVQAERLPLDNVTESDEPDELRGATRAEVHCWIKDQTHRNGLHIIAGTVAEHGWVVTEIVEQAAVTRDDFEGEYLQYFEQALTDSEVFLYEIEDAEGEE